LDEFVFGRGSSPPSVHALHLSDRFEYQAHIVAHSQAVLSDLGEQVSGLLVFFVCVQLFASQGVGSCFKDWLFSGIS
jgi:hypothetical protein